MKRGIITRASSQKQISQFMVREVILATRQLAPFSLIVLSFLKPDFPIKACCKTMHVRRRV